jgi:hypothetical protein
MENKENSKQKKIQQEQQNEHQQNSLLARVSIIYP